MANTTPIRSIFTSPLLRLCMTQPHTANRVARYQRRLRDSRQNRRPRKPPATGALPIPTMVPTATPVRPWRQPQKAELVQGGQACCPAYQWFVPVREYPQLPCARASRSSTAPPTTSRSAPMTFGSNPAGENAWAVPVVPQSTAAAKISPPCYRVLFAHKIISFQHGMNDFLVFRHRS